LALVRVKLFGDASGGIVGIIGRTVVGVVGVVGVAVAGVAVATGDVALATVGEIWWDRSDGDDNWMVCGDGIGELGGGVVVDELEDSGYGWAGYLGSRFSWAIPDHLNGVPVPPPHPFSSSAWCPYDGPLAVHSYRLSAVGHSARKAGEPSRRWHWERLEPLLAPPGNLGYPEKYRSSRVPALKQPHVPPNFCHLFPFCA